MKYNAYRDVNCKYRFCAFSFGGGVQSTAIMLLIKYKPNLLLNTIGHLPDIAIFADTGAELKATWDHIQLLKDNGIFDKVPLKVVQKGVITKKPYDSYIPYFTESSDNKRGMLRRKCTSELKIRPVRREIRSNCRTNKPKSASCWLGISCDEITRMKESKVGYIENVFPLIELGWDRQDCYKLIEQYGYNVPKSACYMCPYRKDWKDLTALEIEKLMEFDSKIRQKRFNGLKKDLYLHGSLRPISEVIENQNAAITLFDDFAEECDGMCGV